jgi:sugar phosphate isomerase/epimerase
VQLYTLRSVLPRDVPGVLASVAKIGYREVETAGYGNVPAADFRKALDAAGLTAPAAHVDLNAIDAGLAASLENCAIVGHQWLVVPSLPNAVRTPDGYKRVGETLGKAADAARKAGVRIAYHNHDIDFTPIDGTTGMDLLMKYSPPEVAAELDVYWIVKAGGNPFAFIDSHRGRVKMLHLKDASPAPDMTMLDVGAGTIDWPKLLPHAKAAGVEHVFVENDRPGTDPLAAIKTSYDYVSRVGSSK